MATDTGSNEFTFKPSTEELAMLTVIAEADGRKLQDVLRSYIVVDYYRRFGVEQDTARDTR